MSKNALLWGPLSDRTLHLCIDMQNVFAEETPWRTPWMKRVLPLVAEIAGRHPDHTVFTRFIPPSEPAEAPGTWRRYFERWEGLTLKRADPWLFELVEPLQRFIPPARVLDKPFYSPFHGTDLAATLRAAGCNELVISGAETDMCVLAAVLDAVDMGLRVVLPVDALCSSSDAMHDALLALYGGRFAQQVETTDTDTILSNWQ
jgi:nicotinamidase-related amidase